MTSAILLPDGLVPVEHSFCQAWARDLLLAVLMEHRAELYLGRLIAPLGLLISWSLQEVVPPAGPA